MFDVRWRDLPLPGDDDFPFEFHPQFLEVVGNTAPAAVVREIDEIAVLLGPADHLDGVRVLEAFVVANRFEVLIRNIHGRADSMVRTTDEPGHFKVFFIILDREGGWTVYLPLYYSDRFPCSGDCVEQGVSPVWRSIIEPRK